MPIKGIQFYKHLVKEHKLKFKLLKFPAIGASVWFLGLAAHAMPVSGQGTWEKDLEARLIQADGTPSAYYDKALDITWLANANPSVGAANEAHGGYALPGQMNFSDAVVWVEQLNVDGVIGWRLPDLTIQNPGYAVSGTDYGWNVTTANSELAHMFYVTLGNSARYDELGNIQATYGLTNTAKFLNLQSNAYWTGTKYSSNQDYSWEFATSDGSQAVLQAPAFIWAVHNGDVATVPESRSCVLAMLGLCAVMCGVRRQRVRLFETA